MALGTQFSANETEERFAPGRTVAEGRYRLLRQAGEDRFGQAFLAWDQARESAVSVKLLKREISASQPLIRWLRQQWTDLEEITHPHLQRIVELYQSVGHCLLIEEWIEGDSLLGLLQTRGALSLAELLPLLDQIAAILDFARDQRFASGNLDLTRIALHFPDHAGEVNWSPPFEETLESWPLWQVKFHPLSQDSRRNAGDFTAFFSATVYRLLGGNPSAGPRARYVPLPGLSEEGNFALKHFLAEGKRSESCRLLLDKLTETENLTIAKVEVDFQENLPPLSLERLRTENQRWEEHFIREAEERRQDEERRQWEEEQLRQEQETIPVAPVETAPPSTPAQADHQTLTEHTEAPESIGSIDDLTGEFDAADSPIDADAPPIISMRPRRKRRKPRNRKFIAAAVAGLLIAGTTGGYTWMTQLPEDPTEIRTMSEWRQARLFSKCESELATFESLDSLLNRVDYYQSGFEDDRAQVLLARAATSLEQALLENFDPTNIPEDERFTEMPPWKQMWLRETLAALVQKSLGDVRFESDVESITRLGALIDWHAATEGENSAWRESADQALARIREGFIAQENRSLPPQIADLMMRLGASSDPILIEARAHAALDANQLTEALEACLELLSLQPDAEDWFPNRASLIDRLIATFSNAYRDWELTRPDETLQQGLRHFLTSLAENHTEGAALISLLEAKDELALGNLDTALEKLGGIAETLPNTSPLHTLAFDKAEVLLRFLRTAQTGMIRVRIAQPKEMAILTRAAEIAKGMASHETANRALFLAWMESDLPQGEISTWFDRASEWSNEQDNDALYWSAVRQMLEGVRSENGDLLRLGVTQMEKAIAKAPKKRALDASRLLGQLFGVPAGADSLPKATAEQQRLEYLQQEGLAISEEVLDELNRTETQSLGLIANEKEGLLSAIDYIDGALERDPTDFKLINDALYYRDTLSQLNGIEPDERAYMFVQMESLAFRLVEENYQLYGWMHLHKLTAGHGHSRTPEDLERIRDLFETPPEDPVKRGEWLYWKGMWYNTGEAPFSRNPNEARRLIQQAADLGNPLAREALGRR